MVASQWGYPTRTKISRSRTRSWPHDVTWSETGPRASQADQPTHLIKRYALPPIMRAYPLHVEILDMQFRPKAAPKRIFYLGNPGMHEVVLIPHSWLSHNCALISTGKARAPAKPVSRTRYPPANFLDLDMSLNYIQTKKVSETLFRARR